MALSVTTAEGTAPVSRAGITLALCFCAAVIEGVDLQSMGVAAPGMAPEFHLSKGALAQVLSASPLGLLFGAFLGGRLADLWGRRRTLILSVVVFGIFSLATAWAQGFTSLLILRLLCGLGLGGAFPNLIALTAEASGGRNNILNVVITAAGMPTGGAFAALIGFFAGSGAAGDWRTVFYVGGIAPLLLAPLMMAALPESPLFQQAQATQNTGKPGILSVLFDRSRIRQTLLLWVAYFLTALMLHLLLNWMPQLMVAKGFTRPDAFLIQIIFNLSSAAGSIAVGLWMQRRPSRVLLFACYVGLAAALFVIASLGQNIVQVAITAAFMGTFLIGAQFVLYGLTPAYYETIARGTGTGASVAAGRLGSVVGPLLAGQLLGAGATAAEVLQSLVPITGAAAVAALVLMFLPRANNLARTQSP